MQFVGNQKVIERLNKVISKGTAAQAYLFKGPRHVGKHTLARYFAASLIRGEKRLDLESELGTEVLVDLISVAPEKEEKKGIVKERDIKIETIREALANLALFPYGGRCKVLIIDQAHKLGTGAQNALLKTLEEPNHTSVLILVTDEDSHLLPTIKSRCQNVDFALLEEAALATMLGELPVGGEELLFLSLGRPGLLRKLQEDGEFLRRRQELAGKMRGLAELPLGAKLSLAEELSKDDSMAIDGLTFLIWNFRKQAAEEKNAEKLAYFYSSIQKIQESSETLQRTNASSRLVLENLLINI